MRRLSFRQNSQTIFFFMSEKFGTKLKLRADTAANMSSRREGGQESSLVVSMLVILVVVILGFLKWRPWLMF